MSVAQENVVECDAIILRSTDHALGCVVAAPDCANPTEIAASILKESCQSLEYGVIIRPCCLVGPAAVQYAKERSLFQKCSVRVDQSSDLQLSLKQYHRAKQYAAILKAKQREVEDTVGCIVISVFLFACVHSRTRRWWLLGAVEGAGCVEAVVVACAAFQEQECGARSMLAWCAQDMESVLCVNWQQRTCVVRCWEEIARRE